jgi:hypothetical protein
MAVSPLPRAIAGADRGLSLKQLYPRVVEAGLELLKTGKITSAD